MEEGHAFNKKLFNVIDEGDRLPHAIEYSTHLEEEPNVRYVYWFSGKPKV
jgi:hypothetical protein